MPSRRTFGAGLAAAAGVAISRWYATRDERRPVKVPVAKQLTFRVGAIELFLTYNVLEYSTDKDRVKSDKGLKTAMLRGRAAPVTIGDLKIPSSPDVYWLSIIPAEIQWTLAVVGPGLTSETEIGRTQMATRRLESFVENLELLFEDESLKMRWGTTEASVNVAAG